MDDYAADVEAMLDALDIETAVIGGLSMGGYVTFALHRRAPERFSGIVLADTKAEADTAEGREGRRAMSELVRIERASARSPTRCCRSCLSAASHARRRSCRARSAG